MPPASLYKWGRWHQELIADTTAKGIRVREWMDEFLARGDNDE
jgi:hypothetical protein